MADLSTGLVSLVGLVVVAVRAVVVVALVLLLGVVEAGERLVSVVAGAGGRRAVRRGVRRGVVGALAEAVGVRVAVVERGRSFEEEAEEAVEAFESGRPAPRKPRRGGGGMGPGHVVVANATNAPLVEILALEVALSPDFAFPLPRRGDAPQLVATTPSVLQALACALDVAQVRLTPCSLEKAVDNAKHAAASPLVLFSSAGVGSLSAVKRFAAVAERALDPAWNFATHLAGLSVGGSGSSLFSPELKPNETLQANAWRIIWASPGFLSPACGVRVALMPRSEREAYLEAHGSDPSDPEQNRALLAKLAGVGLASSHDDGSDETKTE